MYHRNIYLEKLIKLIHTEPIKVVTGVRRCGKSSLLDLFTEYLLETGTPGERIVRMNFELDDFDYIKRYRDISAYVKPRLSKEAKTYVLLDEVQQIPGWEKAVNSLRAGKNVDLYITGSNAHMLSSELATLLSGRYIEIKMLPLSFKEYLEFNDYQDGQNLRNYFTEYLEYGGFPGLHEMNHDENIISAYLGGIYNTILMKDVVTHYTVRDAALLEKVVRFVTANIGNMVSAKKISDYLTSAGRKTSHETIDSYLGMLENAYLLYKAQRYDIKGKELLKTQGKYYIVDTGLRFWALGRKSIDLGYVLENIVYLELLRRGNQVFVGWQASASGTADEAEVDFVAIKDGIKAYYQVTATMQIPDVRERELRSLRTIKDNYEKSVISMDDTPFNDYEGIKHVNIVEFLMR